MTKLRTLALLLTAFTFSASFLSCSAASTESEKTQNVLITLNGESFSVPSGAYRTILPESWTYGVNPKSASLQYVLAAFAISNETIDDGVIGTNVFKTVVSYTDLSTARGVSLSLKPGSWRLILSAYTQDASLTGSTTSTEPATGTYEYYACGVTDCVFTSTKTITLDSDTYEEALTFNLLPVTSEDAAAGTLSLQFTMYPPDTFKTVSWYLSKYGESMSALSGTAASYTLGSSAFTEKFTTVAYTAKGCSAYYYTTTAITETVAPGKYWFVLTCSDKNDMRMLTYPILVVIDGDNTSYGDVILRKSIFNSSPLSASDLTLQYISYGGYSTGSDATHIREACAYAALTADITWQMRLQSANNLYEEFTALPTSDYTFLFKLYHTWSDNADNETAYHYVLTNNSTEVSNVSDYAAGNTSLLSELAATYATGSALIDYDFSLRAENEYSNKTGSASYTATEGFDEWQTITGTKVFMILYHLADGIKVAKAAGSETASEITYFGVPYIKTQESSAIDLLSSTGSSYPTITNLPDGKTLEGWKISGEGDSITTLSKEASGVNVILEPVFSN